MGKFAPFFCFGREVSAGFEVVCVWFLFFFFFTEARGGVGVGGGVSHGSESGGGGAGARFEGDFFALEIESIGRMYVRSSGKLAFAFFLFFHMA